MPILSKAVRWNSLDAARAGLRELWRLGTSLGSVHTLGDLHDGHGLVIRAAAAENEAVVVTIVPNMAQFAPGVKYRYDPDIDASFARAHGATHILTPDPAELYPDSYRTFLDQGPCYGRLDGTVVPFLFRGMITMSFRWICFTRATRTYWGLKDIGQYLLVKQAVDDFGLDTAVREVPCVRFTSGFPISSRLLRLPRDELVELAGVYHALEAARVAIVAGERSSVAIRELVVARASDCPMTHFRFHYVKVASPADFAEPEVIALPLIIHCALTNGTINHFDGLLIRNETELREGPPVLWLDRSYP